MRKPLSINCVAKKTALGAMLASSVAMFASNPIKNEKTETQPKTEVVSKDGAEALKAITFPMLQQNPKVPTTHNKALDEKFLKLAHNEEEEKIINEFLVNNYNECGTYLASATIQQNLDLNMFLAFLDGNIEILKKFDGKYSSVFNEYNNLTYYDAAKKAYTPQVKQKLEYIKNNLGNWLQDNYFKIYSEPLTFDHPPDYDEILSNLKNFSQNNNLEFSPGKKMFKNFNYNDAIQYAIKKNSNNSMNEQQKKINIIPTVMNSFDASLFVNICGLYYDTNHDADFGLLLSIYIQAIMPVKNSR